MSDRRGLPGKLTWPAPASTGEEAVLADVEFLVAAGLADWSPVPVDSRRVVLEQPELFELDSRSARRRANWGRP